MVKLNPLFMLLLILTFTPQIVLSISLKDRVSTLEKRIVDQERLQREQARKMDKRFAAIDKRSIKLTQGYRGFFDELEAFRRDLQQMGNSSEEVAHGKRQLLFKLQALEKKIEAQGIDLFEIKELIKAQANAKPAPLSEGEVKGSFNLAMKQFRQYKWGKAQHSFLTLFKQAPQNKLAAEALYYGSFAAFMQKDWKNSNQGFSDLISLYPDSKRLLSARWRLASGLLKTKDYGAAKNQLRSLAKQKKDKSLAKKAKRKLKRLK